MPSLGQYINHQHAVRFGCS